MTTPSEARATIAAPPAQPPAAREIVVVGRVQGVGFRPFVHGLATRLGVRGWVRNEGGAVRVVAEAPPPVLDRLVAELAAEAPPLAAVEDVRWRDVPAIGHVAFSIHASEAGAEGPIVVPPDVATCEACLAELGDRGDRRWRYPFLNCTACGPRLTIIEAMPYDRARTTMAAFPLCAACAREYHDPADRRFHAQPTACAACGPALTAFDGSGVLLVAEALGHAVEALRAGRIVALKSLGGFHLATSALDESAVARLRARKGRPDKPFALMVADLAAAEGLVELDPTARELLASPRRPIVLLPRRAGCPVAPSVAPGTPELGVMLPSTPLHHLLLDAMAGTPLVMTSGNHSDEPIAIDDDEARARLGEVADVFLGHDRPIRQRADDSVIRLAGGRVVPIRRSRGFTPDPTALPRALAHPTLALGAQLKAVFALGEGARAVLGHHVGDLDDMRTYQAYQAELAHYERLFVLATARVVHDMHPAYASTALARELARTRGLARVEVQHHHAHLASCLAEHGLDVPAIGVVFDGTGYGPDGTVWGGEVLVGDCALVRRAAHLRPVPMPGASRAIDEPWRMAVAWLAEAGLPLRLAGGAGRERPVELVARAARAGLNAPTCTSMGRLFDAVAAIAGLRDEVSFEGQAAIALEHLAATAARDGAYGFALAERGDVLELDPRPVVARIVADMAGGVAPALVARRFHAGVAEAVVRTCERLRAETGIGLVALTGGVFQNALLLAEAEERLATAGFRVLTHRLVPANDGGIALGQLAVVAARDARMEG